MTKAFRGFCLILAVVMSTLCLTACSWFDKGNDDGDDYEEEYEVVLSDESNPLTVTVGKSITVSVLSPIGDPIWESADETIATVTNKGVITGVKQGSTILGVLVGESFTSRDVIVLPEEEQPENPEDPNEQDPPEEKETLSITPSTVSVEAGSSVSVTAVSSKGSSITWTSLNRSVATVSGNTTGTITGLNAGSTTVIARSSTGAAAMCTVTVTPRKAPETISLNRSSLIVYVGDEAELIATTSDGSTVSWSSSDTSVATVSNGTITAKTVGKTTITASIPNGANDTCVIDVIKKPDTGNIPQKDGYTLTWNDEFNGNSLDTTKWSYQTGIRDYYNGVWSDAWFWGNSELQYYTDTTKNVSVSDGCLNIKAIKEIMDDGRTYSSGRIITRDKFSQTYGYFEARMKTPTGNGMWPAFWMLPQPNGSYGTNNGYGGWPHSGEIDIMEAKGRKLDKTDHTIHFSSSTGEHRYLGSEYALSSNTDQWHTYAVDWTPLFIKWYVDGELACHYNSVAWSTQSSSEQSAPFDKPYYILLNLAVGGQYDGYIEPDETFISATMQVDYIRVWQNNLYV